ncbi:MAG: hypothetical protein R3F62_17195 [Planctomycetota bacterium]
MFSPPPATCSSSSAIRDGVLRAVFGMPHAIEEHAGGSSLRLGTQFFAFDAEGRLERMTTAHTSPR